MGRKAVQGEVLRQRECSMPKGKAWQLGEPRCSPTPIGPLKLSDALEP